MGKDKVSVATLNENIDKTIHKNKQTYRKPRTIFSYENMFLGEWYQPTFGSTIFYSLLNMMSSIFIWGNLPETFQFKSDDIERFIVESGRVKLIKVGKKYFVVHITPQEWTYTGQIKKSWIIEPYLGKLNGKETEIFDNVEIRNNGIGISLIRSVYPYIDAIDDAMWNLGIHSNMLNVLGYVVGENTTEDSKKELEDSVNQWLINGKPVKVFEKNMLEDGNLPISKIEVNDAVASFISIVQFNENKMLNVLGIPNNNVEGKQERLITGEIDIQNILQSALIDNMFMERKKAAKEINEKFGLNITVEIKKELLDLMENIKDNKAEGKENDKKQI